ncbi:PLP-dependent cysteine synthase family protein [Leucobacter sp. CSA1]|uniref:PLP-dependent cysteine synthase family protein n=1 Tax=Leucobacter chromiisoli TaxID=2796471 RepID=A0A934UUX7_9MICO|nr:PLP-dependent cysteine synthase family protein [Leucobacter chromiisoli]MBK0419285.1 PLP-dependent cysteine synthase family protein [Leucobacter chromiisoli]
MPALPPVFPDPTRSQTYESVLELIGNTPLVKLNRLTEGLPASVYVKLDGFNLGGSSKDRIGLNIVREAVASGRLLPGGRIADTGAGNTAIGIALAGNATGHPSSSVPLPTLSPEKANLLAFLGVELLHGRPDVPRDDPEHWANVARARAASEERGWWSHQESNHDNPAAHIASTGPEIWHQTAGRVTHFLAQIATGGTVSGTGAYLHRRNPEIEVIATDYPDSMHSQTNLYRVAAREPGFERLEHDWPENIDLDVIDRFERRDREAAIELGWRAAREEGLLIGVSSALSLRVALDLAAEAREDDVFVVFSADSARDYVSREYNLGWLRENGYAALAERIERGELSAAPRTGGRTPRRDGELSRSLA